MYVFVSTDSGAGADYALWDGGTGNFFRSGLWLDILRYAVAELVGHGSACLY